jgi:hypothetical protein
MMSDRANDWCGAQDPRHIVDLVKRVARVSVETVRIFSDLPASQEAPQGNLSCKKVH